MQNYVVDKPKSSNENGFHFQDFELHKFIQRIFYSSICQPGLFYSNLRTGINNDEFSHFDRWILIIFFQPIPI